MTAEAGERLFAANVPDPVPSCKVFLTEIPPWVQRAAVSIAYNGGSIGSFNGATIDIGGDLILYRRLADEDRDRFNLPDVEEVWIQYKMRWEE